MQKWIILIVVLIIIAISVFIVLNVNIETEYTPEGEIDDEELRKTLITLYFKDKESGSMVSETRLIDSKELISNPYKRLLELLFDGPETENYERIIPDKVQFLDARLKNNYVVIELNDYFLDDSISDETRDLVASSIYETLTNLKEVEGIKIVVNDNVVSEIP